MSKARNIADIGSDDVISTSSTGIDVTGTVTADSLTVDGTGTAIDLRSNNNGGTALNTLRFTDTDVTAVNNAEIGKIEFYATDTAAVVASIAGRNADASPDGYLQFKTAEGTTLRSRMVIDNTGDISFYEDTGTTAKLFWDASAESLGIGTATFTGANAFMDDLVVYNATAGTGAGLSIISNATDGYSSIAFGDTADWDTGRVQYNHTDNSMAFHANSAERMRIGSSGNITLGPSGVSGVTAIPNYSAGAGLLYWNRTNTTAVSTALRFDNAGVAVGAIIYNNNSTAYNTSSDYRLKTDAQPMTGASARVQALNPVNFEWIADGTRVDGFLAHEAQSVVPECATGTKDAMMDEEYEVTAAVYEDVVIEAVLDDEGNELEAERTEQNLVTEAVMGTRSVPDYQGIDQSKLVPLLTAALQEALTKIDTLEAQNATFETRLTALEAV